MHLPQQEADDRPHIVDVDDYFAAIVPSSFIAIRSPAAAGSCCIFVDCFD